MLQALFVTENFELSYLLLIIIFILKLQIHFQALGTNSRTYFELVTANWLIITYHHIPSSSVCFPNVIHF